MKQGVGVNETAAIKETASQPLKGGIKMRIFDKLLGNKRKEIKRGGFEEPYCSDKCYNKAGKEIADRILMGTSGVCAFCQSPVYASMENAGECAFFPYRKQLFFICKTCFPKGKEHVKTINECCMCGKSL